MPIPLSKPFERIERLSVQVSSITSFVIPEITVIPVEKMEEFFQQKEELKQYRHFMEELWRQQEHILSPEEERLLAMSADLSTAAGSIFNMFNNADIKFPTIKDETGQEVELTKAGMAAIWKVATGRCGSRLYCPLQYL